MIFRFGAASTTDAGRCPSRRVIASASPTWSIRFCSERSVTTVYSTSGRASSIAIAVGCNGWTTSTRCITMGADATEVKGNPTMAIKLATGPVTWGVDFAETPTNPPWQQVLDDITASGLPAMELGPVGYLPEDADTVRRLLAERNLESAGSFIFDDIHDPDARDRLLDIAERVSRMIAASGGTILSLIDKPDDTRVATAGRPGAAPRMDAERWAQMVDQLNAL